MRLLLVLLVLGVLLLPACKEEPPPPSPEEIYQQIVPALDPLKQVVAGRGPVEGPWLGEVKKGLAAAKQKHEVTDNGKIALSRVRNDVMDIIKAAKDAERWKLVLRVCQLYEILEPNTISTRRYIDMARLELARPIISVKGFIEDEETGDIYVFLEAHIRGKNMVDTFKVREGEEFLDPPHTVRFVEILGNNRGVRLEYLAIEGDMFDVMAP